MRHLNLGLVGKEQKLGRTRMGRSVCLAWVLGSRVGNRILRLDGVVPGKSPEAFLAVCFVPGSHSFRSEGAGPFLLPGHSGKALALSVSEHWALD